MNWKKWLLGLIGACVNSAASSVTVIIVDPVQFNLFQGGAKKLGIVALVSFIFGGALYLKQSPLPVEEKPPEVAI